MTEQIPSNINIQGSYGTYNLVIGAENCKVSIKEIDIINDNVSDIESLLTTLSEQDISIKDSNKPKTYDPLLNSNYVKPPYSLIHSEEKQQQQQSKPIIITETISQSISQSISQTINELKTELKTELNAQSIPNSNNNKKYINHNQSSNTSKESKPTGKFIPKMYSSGKYRRTYDASLIK